MKSQILLLIAAAVMPALADKPKLNQYRTLDDCRDDKDILFHAAPVSGRCYNLDDETGAFFQNSGGMLFPKAYTGKDCKGEEFSLTGAHCEEKGRYRSYKCS